MQHVLITGASRSSLGRVLALGFSANGWTVSAYATDPDANQSLAAKLGPELSNWH